MPAEPSVAALKACCAGLHEAIMAAAAVRRSHAARWRRQAPRAAASGHRRGARREARQLVAVAAVGRDAKTLGVRKHILQQLALLLRAGPRMQASRADGRPRRAGHTLPFIGGATG